MTTDVLAVLNKWLAMGFSLREACAMADRALGLKTGSARNVLVGRAS